MYGKVFAWLLQVLISYDLVLENIDLSLMSKRVTLAILIILVV